MADFKLFTSLRYDPLLQETPKHEDLNTTDWNRTAASPWYMLDYHRDRLLRAATYFGWTMAVDMIDGSDGLKRLEDFLGPFAKEAGSSPRRVKIILNKYGNLTYETSPAKPIPLGNLFPAHLPAPPASRPQTGWTAEEDRFIIELRASGAEWDDIARRFQGRSAIGCCQHHMNLMGQEEQDRADRATEEQAVITAPQRMHQPEYQVLVDSERTQHTEYTHYKTTKRQMYDDARNRHGLGLADPKEVLLVNPADGSIMEATLTTPYFWRGGRWVTPPVSQIFELGKGSGGNDGTTRRWALEKSVTPYLSCRRHACILTNLGDLLWKRLSWRIASKRAKHVGSATVFGDSYLEG